MEIAYEEISDDDEISSRESQVLVENSSDITAKKCFPLESGLQHNRAPARVMEEFTEANPDPESELEMSAAGDPETDQQENIDQYPRPEHYQGYGRNLTELLCDSEHESNSGWEEIKALFDLPSEENFVKLGELIPTVIEEKRPQKTVSEITPQDTKLILQRTVKSTKSQKCTPLPKANKQWLGFSSAQASRSFKVRQVHSPFRINNLFMQETMDNESEYECKIG